MNKVETCLNVTENNAETQRKLQSLRLLISEIWQQWINWWTSRGEIQVRQRINHDGNRYWQAYNPLTGRSLCSNSELEIRLWIEQQLYRSGQ